MITLGARCFRSFLATRGKERLPINLSYWEMKKKWFTATSLGPFVFLLTLQYERITYQPTGAEMKSTPFKKHLFISYPMLRTSLGWEKQK